MSSVRVKQKYQVTIPAEVREALDLREGDILDAKVVDGNILLTPQEITARRTLSNKARTEKLMSYFGAAKGLFKTAQEVDAHIESERNSWDK